MLDESGQPLIPTFARRRFMLDTSRFLPVPVLVPVDQYRCRSWASSHDTKPCDAPRHDSLTVSGIVKRIRVLAHTLLRTFFHRQIAYDTGFCPS